MVPQTESETEKRLVVVKGILCQYFGHLMWRTDSLEKTLMLGKIESRRRGRQRMRWLDGITDLMHMSLSMFQELVMLQSMGLQRVGHNWVTELNWTGEGKRSRRGLDWEFWISRCLCSATREATAMRSPWHCHQEQLLLTTARESPHAATKTQCNNNNNNNNK